MVQKQKRHAFEIPAHMALVRAELLDDPPVPILALRHCVLLSPDACFEPAHTQDLVHAQAYFVRPLLRITLAFLWLASAFAGFLWAQEWSAMLAQRLPAFRPAIGPVLIGASLLDLAIAVLLFVRWRPRALALVQLGVVMAYTVALTLLAPGLWLEPFGPLVKNVPILAAILAHAAIERER